MDSDKRDHDTTDLTQQKIQGIPLITEPVRNDYLNERQQLDYAEERRDMFRWLLKLGKNPEKGEGYAATTLKPSSYRMNQFYRWVWIHEDGYTTAITTEHADEYFEDIKLSDKSNEDKNERIKSLKRIFKWWHHQRSGQKWTTDVTFETKDDNPRDFLRLDERKKIRQAALEYESIPSYNNLSPERRDRWKTYLAQKLGNRRRTWGQPTGSR